MVSPFVSFPLSLPSSFVYSPLASFMIPSLLIPSFLVLFDLVPFILVIFSTYTFSHFNVILLQVHDTSSSINESKASSLAWDNSADLLDNAHILPSDMSAQNVDDINIMENNQGFHIILSELKISFFSSEATL